MWRIPVAATLLVILVALLLGPDRQPDASIPPRLQPSVGAARANALDHLDLLEPGSRLRLIGARCRDDGAALLYFTNRWLWIAPRTIEVRVLADGQMGGGGYVRDGNDPEIDAFFADGRDVDCE